jgi:Zn-dependent peptidase ImmA (M78 family)
LAPKDLPTLDDAIRERLCGKHKWAWSAFTLPTPSAHVIVINPEHPARRQSNDIMHELAHILLEHTPGNMFFGANGVALRSHDKVQEEEAKWLAGALLLPRESLFAIRRLKLTDEEACEKYAVSEAMLTFRFGVTAVDKQLAFARRRSTSGTRSFR